MRGKQFRELEGRLAGAVLRDDELVQALVEVSPDADIFATVVCRIPIRIPATSAHRVWLPNIHLV